MREQFYIAYRAARMGDDTLSDNARISAAVQVALSDDHMESQRYRERCRSNAAHELRLAKQHADMDAVRSDLRTAGLRGGLHSKRGMEEWRRRVSRVTCIRRDWHKRIHWWSYCIV